MKERILGIDTGTNSLGWAIVDYDSEAKADKYHLIDKGVHIFQEGVKIEKGIESSRAAERTMHKHQRIGYWRRKVRKIKLLRLLIENGLCPMLSNEELNKWRSNKEYPLNDDFMSWQRTDESENKNPYYYRNLCLSETLDMGIQKNRYIVGRAIYHLNQRRGFLSNRKEEAKPSDGAVKTGIDDINSAMQEGGFEYLGQYFYSLYHKRERIRAKYTDRLEHYEKELLAICKKQGLDEGLTNKLRKLIITQRPLKSQKHTVGHCVFEPSKTRCPSSHPLFEQYRMFAFINHIKIRTPKDSDMRFLTVEEKDELMPLFLKHKKDFKFEDIAKKLSGSKNNYSYYKDKNSKAYQFNYDKDDTVSGCPVIAQLSDVFEAKDTMDSWLDAACEVYSLGEGKNRLQILNDIWHVLFFFEDKEHLYSFAKEKLQLDDKHAEMFSNIKIPSDYASLSLAAIRKILPYMKQYGMIYSHAVFMANLYKVIPCEIDKEALLPMIPREDADDIVGVFNEYNPEMSEIRTREEYVKRFVAFKYKLDDSQAKKLKCLYHPSMIDTYPKVRKPNHDGYFQLGSPRTNSVRNPMAMRSLFRLRHVINTLLKEGKIDNDTTIRIEFARELNDSNKRAAIRQWQRENEKRHEEYAKKIKETFGESYEPTEVDLLKYKLWEEQEHKCLYTWETIGVEDLFDANKYDIEHTIPRSIGGDSTEMNLTICQSRFNREVKRAQMPSELANIEDILERIETWKDKYESLDKQIKRLNTHGVTEKEMKDRIIQKIHRLKLERNYWRGKYSRFTMTEVPEGFSRRQGIDIGIISKYARLYLKSLFGNVYIVKGLSTSDFRKIWGIQEEYEKKQRVNHCHHAIDAVTIACIGKAEYDKLAQYYHDEERREWGLDSRKASFPKPWTTFTEDVKSLSNSIIVSHYTADNMPKHTRKNVRKDGKKTGKTMQGDTARGSLHLDTFYGAIERDGEIRYVVRKPIDQIDPKNIVDSEVKRKVEEAIAEHGTLKKAAEAGIWMNREKGIRINKVRVFQNDVTKPLTIRTHRDLSVKEYKRPVYAKNENNYLAAIYERKDKKGKVKREFLFFNYLEAARHYKNSMNERCLPIAPLYNENGLKLKNVLRMGTMVLLYENSPEELYDLGDNIQRRLYKVTAIEATNKRLILTHHQEARESSLIPVIGGKFVQNEVFRPKIRIMMNQLQALVQGHDFQINEIGKITFLHR